MYEKVLADTASALERAGIRYLMIGGQAVLLYGEARLTQDVDMVVLLPVSEFASLYAVLSGLNLVMPFGDIGEIVKKHGVLPAISRDTGLRLDFIFSDAPFEQAAVSRANEVYIHGTRVRFAAFNDLIIYKIISGRPRDFDDIRGMLRRKGKELDANYVRKWLSLFEKETGETFLDNFEKLRLEMKETPSQNNL